MKRFILSLAVGSMVFSFVLVNVALADYTIGTSITTTGSLTVNSSSGTAVRFQRSGTNIFIFDTTKGRLGIDAGGNLDTKFEVGGTASAQNFLAQGAVQFAGNSASVAYSRFGTTTTNHGNYISASNDLLVSGDVELRGSVSFGGVASISGIVYMNDGRFKTNADSTTAFRFQNAAGTTTVLTIDTTNTRVGINFGGNLDTTFEVGGLASISNASISDRFELTSSTARFGINAGNFTDNMFEVGGLASVSNASISDRFELTSSTARFGINAGNFTDTAFEVGGVASVGTNLRVGTTSTATTSATFETRSTTQGSCFIITDSAGTVKYARINAANAWIINTTVCN